MEGRRWRGGRRPALRRRRTSPGAAPAAPGLFVRRRAPRRTWPEWRGGATCTSVASGRGTWGASKGIPGPLQRPMGAGPRAQRHPTPPPQASLNPAPTCEHTVCRDCAELWLRFYAPCCPVCGVAAAGWCNPSLGRCAHPAIAPNPSLTSSNLPSPPTSPRRLVFQSAGAPRLSGGDRLV
mgnify:CR=1 FL=1